MAAYQIAFHLPTMAAVIQTSGAALPAAVGGVTFKNIGTFEHADVEPALKDLEFDVNHVFFQHVRDALYHVNSKTGVAVPGTLQFPDNITDMAGLTISVGVTSIELGAEFSVKVGEDHRLNVVFTPDIASNQTLTYTTSDATKATVSAEGVVHGVAVGSSTITATSANGKTDTVVATVAAA